MRFVCYCVISVGQIKGFEMRNYTVIEAAEKIGVGKFAILKAIERGKLLSYKRGHQWFVDEKELDRWNAIRRKRKVKND